MLGVIKPKSIKETEKRRAMTIEEETKFINYLNSIDLVKCKYKNIFFIQLFMGLRIGEVLALTIDDIDFEKNIIKINKTLTVDENGKIICRNKTKTDAGLREIPIYSRIMKLLKEQIEFVQGNSLNLLFPNNNGKYTDARKVNYKLVEILKELNITGISTHCLRHTYGTRCIEAGMTAVVLQRLMGHKDVTITLNTYTSVFNKFKEDELEKVNTYLSFNKLNI